MIGHRRRYQLPPLVSHPLDDLWSVIVPIARTNLVTNPSFETNTTSWTASGASIARTTTKQRRGAYSLAITPSAGTNADGAYYGTISLTSGTTYAYSMDFWGMAGVKYQIYVATTGGVSLVAKQFTATGYWQRVSLIYTETSSTTRRLYVTKVSSSRADVCYVDGVQMEACETGNYFATTYIDGDQQGLVPNQSPPAYTWTGTPHASTSSRSGLTRAGGRVMRFKDFGWFLIAIIGLGLAPPQNQVTEYAVLDGGQDQLTRKPTHQFTLAGEFRARTYTQLRTNRASLAALLDRDLIAQDQRLKLIYQAMDGCNLVGEEAEVICKYQGGLEGNTDGHFGQSAPITFTTYFPVIFSPGEVGAALTVQQSVTNANAVLQRSPAGVWSALGTGVQAGAGQAIVTALTYGLDDALYVGGWFGSAGSVANTALIAKWSSGAWSALGTGGHTVASGHNVNTTALGPGGVLYVVGNNADFGGVANTDDVGKWDGSTWSALGTGGDAGTILAVAVGPDGSVYVGGTFTSIGGVAANRIAKWDGSTWSALSTGANATVNWVAFGPDGYLYAGGLFTTMGGVSTNYMAKWTGSAWSALSGLSGGTGAFNFAFGPDGYLYAGGDFTNKIMRWNGVSWAPLGSGVNGNVYAIVPDTFGGLYVSGLFTTAGGITLPDRIARWNGSAWVPLDFDLPGTALIYNTALRGDGELTIAYDTTGTATTAAVTTVTNDGTGKAYPTLIIKGPSSGTSRIYQLVNYTTGRAIYLNLTINAGETCILRFEPDNLSFTSDFQGNIASAILPGSNEADFFLQPGANTISFFAADSTVTATLQWRTAYVSLDDR